MNRHLVFTHGYGAVVSPANSVTSEGQPAFLVKDITQDDGGARRALNITQPRVYFGEAVDSGNFVIVGTKEQEVDYPLESERGRGHLRLQLLRRRRAASASGSFFRRAAFALRFADLNTLIRGQITGDSRVLMVRNIRDIVEKAAPFLHADADPYTVILDGRLVWVHRPVHDHRPLPLLHPPAFTGRLNAQRSDLPNGFNYVRNSVKATVDAYDGTVTLLRGRRDRPDAAAPTGASSPSLFTPMAEMPAGLQRAPALPGGSLPGAERHVPAVPRDRPPGVLQQHPGLAGGPRPLHHAGGVAARLAYSADNRPMVPTTC